MRNQKKQRGSTVIEMALSLLVLMPMLMGTSVIGVNLVRAIQVTQFCRDAAHMFAYGIDFDQAANRTLLTHLAQGLDFRTSGGNGDMIFSVVTYITATECTAAGLPGNTTGCPNMNFAVFTRRFAVGDPSKLTSHFGTPNSNILGANGNISTTNYLTNTSARAANNFSSLMSLGSGQYAYLTEVYVAAPDLAWPGYMSGSGTYSFNIF